MPLVHYWKQRGLMLLAAALSWALGALLLPRFGLPAFGVTHASLLLQGGTAETLRAVLLLAVASATAFVVGLLVAGRVRPAAGVFCSVMPLAGLSWVTGTLRDVLFANAGPGGTRVSSVMFSLAFETLLLAGFLTLAYFVTRSLRRALPSDRTLDDQPGGDSPPLKPATSSTRNSRNQTPDTWTWGEALIGLLLIAAGYVLLTWFLLPTDDKQQVLLGSGIAAFVAAAGIHYAVFPRLPTWAMWAGPLTGALACYLLAASSSGPALGLAAIGVTDFPPTRALPIDHASAGTIGALLAYWYSRKWKQNEQAEETSAASAPA